MPDTVLRFDSPLTPTVQPQAVYWKARWHDAWTAVPELWCSEARWAMNPTIPTAQLQLRYGWAKLRDAPAWGPIFRARNRVRQYVKVVFGTQRINDEDESPTSKTWIGILDLELDELHGTLRQTSPISGETIVYATGKNHFTAYGLESLLDQTSCQRSQIGGEAPQEVQRALPFNPRGPAVQTVAGVQPIRGNRSTAAGDGGVYVFHDELEGDNWSTRDCVRYLLAYDAPRDHSGSQVLPFVLFDPDEVVPNWDSPQLERQDRTVRELLNSLLPRQRLLGYTLEPTESEEGIGQDIRVVAHTFAGEELTFETLPEAVFAANQRRVILAPEQDRGAALSLKRTSVDQFDQVLVRGERRTSLASFSFAEGTLAIGWTSALETEYEQGGSTDPDYPAAGEDEQRIVWQQAARAVDRLRPVYSRFILPTDFGGYVGDGTSVLADQVLQPSDADANAPNPLAPDDRRFLPELPLLANFDYSSAEPVEFRPGAAKLMQPLVLFRRTDWTAPKPRYRTAETFGVSTEMASIGVEEARTWTARVRVDHDDGALWIELTSGEQQQIAKTDFAPQPEDNQVFDDYREILATLAVPWSQYAEATYPAEAPFGQDVNRVLTIEAGSDYRVDYVVPDTVVAIDAAGELVRSGGGYVRDDRPQLAALAKLAWQWYGRVRRSLSYETSLVSAALNLGDYVVSVGDPEIEGDVHVDDVGSVVTLIAITMPLAESEAAAEPPLPKMHFETAFGELDVLKLRRGSA